MWSLMRTFEGGSSFTSMPNSVRNKMPHALHGTPLLLPQEASKSSFMDSSCFSVQSLFPPNDTEVDRAQGYVFAVRLERPFTPLHVSSRFVRTSTITHSFSFYPERVHLISWILYLWEFQGTKAKPVKAQEKSH
jgi:hypothetical protein